MKRFVMPISVALIALSGAAFANQSPAGNGANACIAGHKCPPGQAQKMRNQAQKADDKGAQHARSRPGHALSAAQLKHLPAAPRGQEYRIVDDRVVRIDSDTLKTVAAIGLVSALLNN